MFDRLSLSLVGSALLCAGCLEVDPSWHSPDGSPDNLRPDASVGKDAGAGGGSRPQDAAGGGGGSGSGSSGGGSSGGGSGGGSHGPGTGGGGGGTDAGGGPDGIKVNPSSLALPEPIGAAQGLTLSGGLAPYAVSGCDGVVKAETAGTMLLVAPAGAGSCTLLVTDSSTPTPLTGHLAITVAASSTMLAPTPPMGWNSWNRFGCNVSEDLIKRTADAMVNSGMKEAGYRYVNIDDCWQVSRDSSGTIVADASRFPSGMSALATYIHNKGLKLGVYSDRGTKTCAGRPGSEGHETQDAKTYASWGVDYLKHDNCNVTQDQRTQYTKMRDALRASGRDIVFSICAWRFASWMPTTGELWRTTGDINASWGSITGIIDTNAGLASSAGPGHWNDPDMLEVGNGNLTTAESRAHFSIWAIMAAPLIAGNDLSSMAADPKAILTAKEVIQVNQDLLGHQGTRVRDDGDREVWSKVQSGTGRRAVALFNRGGSSGSISVSWSELGLASGPAAVRDLWAHSDLGSISDKYSANVPAHGVVLLEVSGTEK